jgi:FKBP-type peptidyl-prolyl cis-trans isomerase FklB
MKSKLIAIVLLVAVGTSSVFAQKKDKAAKNDKIFKTELDSISYSMGVMIGSSMKKAGMTQINDKLFAQALVEMLADKEPAIKSEQANQIIQSYMMKMYEKKGKENKDSGAKFLEENKTKEGVITLPSGLQYKVITEGAGESPKATDKVTVHYTGKLVSGKVFDSSVERGEPAKFPVNGVIPGWTEALQLMKPGAKWMLYLPANLAYGEQGVQGIEPNSVLIFEVELLSIDKEEATQEAVPTLEQSPAFEEAK